jgi:hypothetical protein
MLTRSTYRPLTRPQTGIMTVPHFVRAAGLLATFILAVCAGYIATHDLALPIIGLVVIVGGVLWAIPRPAAILLVLAGVVLVPTPAIKTVDIHGIPLQTTLGVVTLLATLWLWRRQKVRGADVSLNPTIVVALLLILVAGMVQLMFSEYAEARPLYQFSFFWISGLFLGSIVASDRRMLDYIGRLGLALSFFAIVEFVINKPNLWGKVIGAQNFEDITTLGPVNRATSTLGHPLVAGTVLITFAFLALASNNRRNAASFAFITAGALVTGSRSAIVGLAVGLIALLLSGHLRLSRKLAIIVATVAIGWIMIASIPALNSAFNSRVLHANSKEERIRLNSLQTLKSSFDRGDLTLLTGRGLQGSQNYLKHSGGNLGFPVYDNQYVTSIYDSGGLVFGILVILIVIGVVRTRPGWQLAAPLLVSASTLTFFEGLYWPIVGVLFWLTVGLASAPATRARARKARALQLPCEEARSMDPSRGVSSGVRETSDHPLANPAWVS